MNLIKMTRGGFSFSIFHLLDPCILWCLWRNKIDGKSSFEDWNSVLALVSVVWVNATFEQQIVVRVQPVFKPFMPDCWELVVCIRCGSSLSTLQPSCIVKLIHLPIHFLQLIQVWVVGGRIKNRGAQTSLSLSSGCSEMLCLIPGISSWLNLLKNTSSRSHRGYRCPHYITSTPHSLPKDEPRRPSGKHLWLLFLSVTPAYGHRCWW